jgi:MtN3 and saliva related transmembrane protein
MRCEIWIQSPPWAAWRRSAPPLSYFPQLKKCWQNGHTGDLSLSMFLVLSLGVALWVLYGVLKSDWVIVGANSISLSFLFGILYFKLRERRDRNER